MGQKIKNLRGHSLTFPKDCRVRLLIAKANWGSELFDDYSPKISQKYTGIKMHLNGTERANATILKGNTKHKNTNLALSELSEQTLLIVN